MCVVSCHNITGRAVTTEMTVNFTWWQCGGAVCIGSCVTTVVLFKQLLEQQSLIVVFTWWCKMTLIYSENGSYVQHQGHGSSGSVK